MALKYKTFDELMASVKSDLPLYADNNLINDRTVIKTIRTVNADLGLRIYGTKDCILDVKDYKADLPKDFLKGITLFMIFEESAGLLSGGIHGTSIREYSREELISKNIPVVTDGCVSSCGECSWFTRSYSQKELIYDRVEQVTLTNNSFQHFYDGCPAISFNGKSQYQVDLNSETLHTNVSKGTIYLSYVSDLVNENGELLILDHPISNDYYEWAAKVKILEDLYYNSEADVERKLADARNNKTIARSTAISLIVNPEIREMNAYRQNLINKFYTKYIKYYV